MSDSETPDRRPYLRAIPPANRVRQRLERVLAEAEQLKILLRLASESEQETTPTARAGVGRG